MDTRLAVISIIAYEGADTNALNQLLSKYAHFIRGRMGLPYKARHVGIINIVIDAPQDDISTLSGKIGMMPKISSKTLYAKLDDE